MAKEKDKKIKEPKNQLKPTRGKSKNWEEILKSLKSPHVTEKASALEEFSKYVFKVPKRANKLMIKKAILDLYGKMPLKISIINAKPKPRKRARKTGFRSGYKKAIVTLGKNDKLDVFAKK